MSGDSGANRLTAPRVRPRGKRTSERGKRGGAHVQMEVLIAIVVIWAVIAFLRSIGKGSSGPTATPRGPSHAPPARTKRDPNTYRPARDARVARPALIQFKEANAAAILPDDLDLEDLVDALTGAPLQRNTGLYQCPACKVFYQADSYDVIRSENGGRCVSCLRTGISNVAGREEQRGRNADPNLVTLATYTQHFGHVITFEGIVRTVLTSRRGTDYAVMFEDQPWTRGFKMVAFKGTVNKIGGEEFLYSLAGRTVRVRGLLVLHDRFGPEIIVNDPKMILNVR